jgi:hypothetical protein
MAGHEYRAHQPGAHRSFTARVAESAAGAPGAAAAAARGRGRMPRARGAGLVYHEYGSGHCT